VTQDSHLPGPAWVGFQFYHCRTIHHRYDREGVFKTFFPTICAQENVTIVALFHHHVFNQGDDRNVAKRNEELLEVVVTDVQLKKNEYRNMEA
jgi:hypothetical protein